MRDNLGRTKIRMRRRSSNSLQDFDGLPNHLREWVRNAVLPWRPLSVARAYKRALNDTGDPHRALAELDRLQEYHLSKDR